MAADADPDPVLDLEALVVGLQDDDIQLADAVLQGPGAVELGGVSAAPPLAVAAATVASPERPLHGLVCVVQRLLHRCANISLLHLRRAMASA